MQSELNELQSKLIEYQQKEIFLRELCNTKGGITKNQVLTILNGGMLELSGSQKLQITFKEKGRYR